MRLPAPLRRGEPDTGPVDTPDRPHVEPLLFAGVAATGIYGGYFGTAQGVILLALLGVFVEGGMTQVNGIENILAGVANLVSALLFIAIADVDWPVAGTVAVGATVGGGLGGRYGRRLPAPPCERSSSRSRSLRPPGASWAERRPPGRTGPAAGRQARRTGWRRASDAARVYRGRSVGNDPAAPDPAAPSEREGAAMARRLVTIAGALLVVAVVLLVVSFLVDALRWLLIIAAVVLVVAALLGWRGRSEGGG